MDKPLSEKRIGDILGIDVRYTPGIEKRFDRVVQTGEFDLPASFG